MNWHARREGKYLSNVYKDYRKMYGRKVRMADIAFRLPFVKEYALAKFNDFFSKDHAGQVIPLEDVITICSIPGRVSLVDCPCSKYLFGKNVKKCMLFGVTAEVVDSIPEFSPVKDIGAEGAVEFVKNLDESGMVHTIWTFKTPYIGVICNCNSRDCVLLHLKDRFKDLNILRKGHEVASVDLEICDGCGNCQKACQFGAVLITGKKAKINHKCYGCGVCRNFCPVGAIQLVPKLSFE